MLIDVVQTPLQSHLREVCMVAVLKFFSHLLPDPNGHEVICVM